MCAAVCDRAEQQLGIDAIGTANCSDRPSMISVHNRHMESGTRSYFQSCDNQSLDVVNAPMVGRARAESVPADQRQRAVDARASD